MNIINLNKLDKKIVIENLIIGHFNVVHNGHIKLFSNLKDISFLIFDNNPSKKYQMYTLDERIQNLKLFHPKNIFVYKIDEDNCIASEFINKYLLKNLDIKNICVGSDFLFGKNKSGNIDLLKKYFNVVATKNDGQISTSKILKLIENGKINEANKLMPINFYYSGNVVHGKKIASKMFFPTANIIENKNINILYGSYVSRCEYSNKKYNSITFIGKPKTIDSSESFVETYIFNFDKDIYDQNIKVEILSFIRESKKFDSMDELILNIKNDLKIAQNYFKNKR